MDTVDRAVLSKLRVILLGALQSIVSEEAAMYEGQTTEHPAATSAAVAAKQGKKKRGVPRGMVYHNSTADKVLSFLASKDDVSQGDLAKGLNVRPATLSGYLNRLWRNGLIEQVSYGHFRRSPKPVLRPSTPVAVAPAAA